MNEAEIIQNLKKGDEKAFRELVEKYRRPVVNTCFGLVHNKEDAEDIAQDVFIEVYRSISRFREESKISTWLYRIAVNRSLNFIRDNKQGKWVNSLEDRILLKKYKSAETIIDDHDDPAKNIENKQKADMLHKAIDSLPQNQRTAFTLNKYENLSYKEISEVMSLSVSSVESLMHRAKKNLQKKLYKCYKKNCI
jgi:RNA polymerase sigma-70 factor, ECF subfamily